MKTGFGAGPPFRVYREAHDLEQNLRRPGRVSGQNSSPHHRQVTTRPLRLDPRRRAEACRRASTPAGEKGLPASSRAWVAFRGSRRWRNNGLRRRLALALAAIASRVPCATSPRRPSPCAARYSAAVIS